MFRIFVPDLGRVDRPTVICSTVIDVSKDTTFVNYFNGLTMTGLLVLEEVRVLDTNIYKDGYGNPLCAFNAQYIGKLMKAYQWHSDEVRAAMTYLLTLPESYFVVLYRGE